MVELIAGVVLVALALLAGALSSLDARIAKVLTCKLGTLDSLASALHAVETEEEAPPRSEQKPKQRLVKVLDTQDVELSKPRLIEEEEVW